MLAFRSDLAPLAAIERALRAAGCSWFGVDLDAVALLRDPWDSDAAFSRLASMIRQADHQNAEWRERYLAEHPASRARAGGG